jgi:hypothetical protein
MSRKSLPSALIRGWMLEEDMRNEMSARSITHKRGCNMIWRKNV